MPPGVSIHPHDGRIVGILYPGHFLEQRVDVGCRDAVDLDVGRWDLAQLQCRVHDDTEQPDTAHHGVEEIVRPVDGHYLTVGKQEGKANDLAGEATVVPRVLSVDVGTDRTGDTGM